MEMSSKQIIEEIYEIVDNYIDLCKINNVKLPCLEIILCGDDPGSASYVDMKLKACEIHGIEHILHNIDSENNSENIYYNIKNKIINAHEKFHPIMIQLPIQYNRHLEPKLLSQLQMEYDVDGLNMNNIFNKYNDLRKVLLNLTPCTSAGILLLMNQYKIDVKNKNVLIVGRSNLLGKPLALKLLDKDANVMITHSKTSKENLKQLALESDIIISTAGQANLITEDMIKQDVVLFDTGFSRIKDEEGKYHIVGDISKQCRDKAKYYNPYTNCIGPLTIAILLLNTCISHYINYIEPEIDFNMSKKGLEEEIRLQKFIKKYKLGE